MKNTDKRKLDYKWVILVVCFLMVFVCLGFCSSNKGLYLAAVTEALGIKRSLFSINDTCRYAATSLINLFLGVLVARFGTRKMVACGFAALTGSMLIYAFAEHIVLFCVGGALLGTGLAFTTGAMVSGIVRQWFDKNIGKYMSIVLCANGVGGALAAQIVSPMINEAGNPFGYRKAYMTVAVILLAVGVLAAVLLRERPNEDGTAQKTATAAKAPATESAPRSGTERFMFGFTAVVVLLTGLVLQSTTGVSPAHMKDVGFSAAFIAGAVSLSSLLLTFSKLFVGAMHDRFGL